MEKNELKTILNSIKQDPADINTLPKLQILFDQLRKTKTGVQDLGITQFALETITNHLMWLYGQAIPELLPKSNKHINNDYTEQALLLWQEIKSDPCNENIFSKIQKLFNLLAEDNIRVDDIGISISSLQNLLSYNMWFYGSLLPDIFYQEETPTIEELTIDITQKQPANAL